ncbi:hypothetical protein Vafri_9128 [Volvox africanus]|uniref:Uncharacterized protein n=1 Tax=Volvox africanus TaxID=51714 RepID=A0A8J4B3Y5_9CHLO|nr:hypothetical protein Vafri_9128 [Volvox africanus]
MPTTAEPSDPPGDPEEPELLLWRRFSLSQYLSALPVRWRRFVGLFHYTLVARPSNDPSLGLQGWRSGALRRWELKFPVLTVFDAPGQAAPDEGFNEWPLFDIFKIDLRDRPSWSAYLASLRRADRWNVKTRTKLFQLYESEGKLTCQVVRMGPQAFMTQWQQRPVAAPLPAVAAAISCHPSGGGADLGTTWRPKSASIAIGEQQAIDFTPAVSLIDPRVSDEAQPTGILTAATAPTSALAAPTSSASLHPLTPPQPPSLPLPQDWVAEEQKEPHQERQQSDFPPKPLPDQAQKWSRKQQHQKQQQQLPQQQQQQQQQRQQQQSRVTTKPLKHGKRRANSAPGNEVLAPPKLVFATPGSVSEADVLLAQMWNLYEQTGTRNGFVECYREQFERLVREAPNIHAVVVREGGSGSGPLLAFGLLLPQRESLQVLYIGMAYDNPLVRQSSCYFQILSVGLQAALAHNESVRQRSVAAAAAADGGKAFSGSDRAADAAVADVAHTDMRQGFIAGGGGSGGGGGGSGSGSDGGGGGGGSGSGSCSGGRTQSEGAAPIMAAVAPTLNAHAEGTVASFANVWLPPPPPPSAPPPPHPLLLGPRVGLIDWLDLGPGRRFVKEHLGAVGHPVSMYTRGIGPIAQLMSRSLLNRHFSPRAYVNDP